MKNLTHWLVKWRETIGVVECPMRRGPKHLVAQPFGRELVAEWQQRGPEAICGHTARKLRLSFASTRSATMVGAVS